MKKICVVTGTRAEYGLLRWVMEGVRKSPKLELQLIVTGNHLSPEFGWTVDDIEGNGGASDAVVRFLEEISIDGGLLKKIVYDHL